MRGPSASSLTGLATGPRPLLRTDDLCPAAESLRSASLTAPITVSDSDTCSHPMGRHRTKRVRRYGGLDGEHGEVVGNSGCLGVLQCVARMPSLAKAFSGASRFWSVRQLRTRCRIDTRTGWKPRSLAVAAVLAAITLGLSACSSTSSNSSGGATSTDSASAASSSSEASSAPSNVASPSVPASNSVAAAASVSPTATIRVSYSYSTTLLPVYAGVAEGLFAKYGLKVEESPESNPVLTTSALGKQYDIVMQTPSGFLAAVQQGLNVIAVSNCAENNSTTPNTYVMVPGDSPIKSLKDLVGKRVGVVNVTSASTIALQYVALKQGLSKDSFKFVTVPFANMADQLKAGNIDAAVPVIPYSTVLEQAGYRSISTPTVEASQLSINSDKSTNAFFIANKTWAQQNPAIIAAWRAGLQDSIDWIAANKAAALQLATQMTDLPASVLEASPLSTFAVALSGDDFKSAAIEDQEVGVTKTLLDTSGLVLP